MEYKEINNSSSLITLLYPEAKFICVKHDNYKDELLDLLVNGKCSYFIDGYKYLSDVKVLQIMPLSNSEVIVQYISNEDFLKYYPKESEEEKKYGRDRIIDDIQSAKRVINGEEDSSLCALASLTKQLLDDNDSLGEDYKNCLLSVLNRWENILLNKNEADYLIPEGYADNSIKETLEDPLSCKKSTLTGVYRLIIDNLMDRTFNYYGQEKTNEGHAKVKSSNL